MIEGMGFPEMLSLAQTIGIVGTMYFEELFNFSRVSSCIRRLIQKLLEYKRQE
jgi:hypothetical protein